MEEEEEQRRRRRRQSEDGTPAGLRDTDSTDFQDVLMLPG